MLAYCFYSWFLSQDKTKGLTIPFVVLLFAYYRVEVCGRPFCNLCLDLFLFCFLQILSVPLF